MCALDKSGRPAKKDFNNKSLIAHLFGGREVFFNEMDNFECRVIVRTVGFQAICSVKTPSEFVEI